MMEVFLILGWGLAVLFFIGLIGASGYESIASSNKKLADKHAKDLAACRKVVKRAAKVLGEEKG